MISCQPERMYHFICTSRCGCVNITDAETLRLDACVQCRSCSRSCPSYRSGGVDPQKTVADVLAENFPKDVWKCLQCHRCTASCHRGIDVAGLMLAIRESDVLKGNVPDAVNRIAAAFARDGRKSLPKGRAETLRRELGLPDVIVSGSTVNELNMILKNTGFRYE